MHLQITACAAILLLLASPAKLLELEIIATLTMCQRETKGLDYPFQSQKIQIHQDHRANFCLVATVSTS